jgi:hypothetical protein
VFARTSSVVSRRTMIGWSSYGLIFCGESL